MKKWHHVAFVGVCLLVLAVLLLAPEVTTPRLPRDENHANRKDYERCPTCHGPGSEAEMPEDHFRQGGDLRPDHAKCYFCHKPPEG